MKKPTNRDLCSALSDLFIIGEINYKYIAKIANNFPIDYVENILLEWVAPILWYEHFSATPEVWGYNDDWLWNSIQENLSTNNNPTFNKKIFLKIQRIFMKWLVKEEWEILKSHLNKS